MSPPRRPQGPTFPAAGIVLLLAASLSAQLPEWTPLTPMAVRARSGTAFRITGGGRVLASGNSPATEEVTVELMTPLEGTAALRLEALPHRSLPAKGPGRAKNGNFVLGSVRLETASRISPDKFEPLKVAKLGANHSQSKYPAAKVLDENPKSGWAILPHAGRDHQIVFLLGTTLGRDARIRVRMTFPFGSKHVLGHFRFAATVAAEPFKGMPRGGTPWATVQGRINTSIDRGVEALLSRQHLDGSMREHTAGRQRTGSTALTVYTLLKSGVDPEHAAIRRAVEVLRRHEPDHTYDAACQILALCTLGEKKDRRHIQRRIRDLLRWQKEEGGYGYPNNQVDLSNTQYAALGLHIAEKAGFRVPSIAWHRMAERTLLHAKPDGKSGYAPWGFAYRKNGKATGSMTAAGVGILAIVRLHLRVPRADVNNGLARGLEWLGRHFTATGNRGGSAGWLLYYLYGLERAGALTNERYLGEHDWYREGARVLVNRQKGDGSWTTSRGDATSNTCFALLFLNKATGSVTGGGGRAGRVFANDSPKHPVSLKASGDGTISVWISRFGADVNEKATWPKEKGLRVKKVEYVVSRAKNLSGRKVIASLSGNPEAPHGTRSFATRHEFSHPGVWWIGAEVTVVYPATKNEPVRERVLKSAPLRVTSWDCRNEEVLAYGTDPDRNLLARARRIRISASSEHGGNWTAMRALDGIQALGWLTKDDDAKPWIRFEMPRSVRADRIAVAHTLTGNDRRTRAKTVEVRINGNDVLGRMTLHRDDYRKTVWAFPGGAESVRSLELRVLDRHVQGKKGVGFSEVELRLGDR